MEKFSSSLATSTQERQPCKCRDRERAAKLKDYSYIQSGRDSIYGMMNGCLHEGSPSQAIKGMNAPLHTHRYFGKDKTHV